MSDENATGPRSSENARKLSVFGYAGGAGMMGTAARYALLYTMLRALAGWDPPYESTEGTGVLLYVAMLVGSPLVGVGVYRQIAPRIDAAIWHGSPLGVFPGSTVALIVTAAVGLVLLAAVALYVINYVFFYIFGLLVVAMIIGASTARVRSSGPQCFSF